MRRPLRMNMRNQQRHPALEDVEDVEAGVEEDVEEEAEEGNLSMRLMHRRRVPPRLVKTNMPIAHTGQVLGNVVTHLSKYLIVSRNARLPVLEF